ncbi:hypothetical protein [Sphingomonas paucimobilis]|uniref:hypothetical protein n=1 Tax=Sphingomonas paucimobilis TaxID=13689 RepID=UPI0028D267CA|nr:hypothetical protein [Sphingomonas paucimobilis]
MPRVFVHTDEKDGPPLVADMYNFQFLPRVGETLVVNEGADEMRLEVLSVQHFADPEKGVGEAAHLTCKFLERWNK